MADTAAIRQSDTGSHAIASTPDASSALLNDSGKRKQDEGALASMIGRAAHKVISNEDVCDKIGQYSTQFLETASLFTGGKVGIGATVLTYGLAQIANDGPAKEHAEDFALGATKGLLMRGAFGAAGKLNGLKWAPAKGVVLGAMSRDLDVLADRHNYQSGQIADKLKQETLNPQSWMLDAAVWGLSEGVFAGANKLSSGALASNRVASGLVLGSTFGMVSAGSGEIVREKHAGQGIQWGKVAEQTLIGGAINGLAAGTGMHATKFTASEVAPHGPGNPDPEAINHDPEMAKRNLEVKQAAVDAVAARMKEKGVNLPDGVSLQASPGAKALKGNIMSFRVPTAGVDPLVRVESTDVPELPEYINPPPKEFKIVSGQEKLNAFRHFDTDGLMLNVRELTGRKWCLFKQYGAEKSLWVQRLGGNEGKLMPEAKQADLVVSCHPENLSAEDKANHVFPDAHGKVWMATGSRDTKLLLQAGDHPVKTWRLNGYTHPVRLDGGYTTINVMAPLLVGDPHNMDSDASRAEWSKMDAMLKVMKDIGVDAVSTDVWWGLIEPEKRRFDWSYYDKLSDHIISSGLKWVPILSFHQCGGNVGDSVTVPLPDYVWSDMAAKLGKPVEMLKFKSEQGHFSNEYISYWADDVAMEHYEAVMRAFQDHFASKANKIGEINVSLGPAGELRFPSYNQHDNNVGYPSRGALQAYGELAIDSLRDFALRKYGGLDGLKKAWDISDLTEDKILPPDDPNAFFGRGDHMNTQYGRDFLDWYNQSLLDHGNRMITTALNVFGKQGAAFYGIDLGVKIPGVHWLIGHWEDGRIVQGSRLAEINAGLIRSSNAPDFFDDSKGNGYRPALSLLHQLLPSRPGQGNLVVPAMTCLEMPDGQDGPSAQAMPHTLARWVGQEAARQGLWLKGENALAGNLFDPNDWQRIQELLDLPNQNGYYHGLTFLRMTDIYDNATARAKISELIHAVRSVETPQRNAA